MSRTDWKYSLFTLLFVTLVTGIIVVGYCMKDYPANTTIELTEKSQSTTKSPHQLSAKKQQMIDLLLPAIQQNNRAILASRKRLLAMTNQSTSKLSQTDAAQLVALASDYKLKGYRDKPDTEILSELLIRIDIIPAGLALGQAALESAWGASRFAQQGNNYFGLWCNTPGCGLVPKLRVEGATHEVESFDSIKANVATYMHHINTRSAYAALRRIRAANRAENIQPTAIALSEGLEKYSGIGHAYVIRLQALIRHNHFSHYSSF